VVPSYWVLVCRVHWRKSFFWGGNTLLLSWPEQDGCCLTVELSLLRQFFASTLSTRRIPTLTETASLRTWLLFLILLSPCYCVEISTRFLIVLLTAGVAAPFLHNLI